MKAIIEQFGKQAVAGAVIVGLAWFFLAPGSFTLVAGGFVVGALAGNYFPALEARAEALIAKAKS